MAYTTIDNPELYFQTKLYTGNSSTQAITLDGDEDMQPDFVWSKPRVSGGHFLSDSIRGGTKVLQAAETNAEITRGSHIQSFDTDGYTLAGDGTTNNNGDTTVSWNWKAGTAFSNDASATGIGSVDSSGSVNTDAGFSIVSFTGNGTAGATIAHGLGAVPSWIILKDRDQAKNWNIYHKGNDSSPQNFTIRLNSTDARLDTPANGWNDTAPTSSVFSIGDGTQVNTSGSDMIAYIFAEKKGYSKFGSYTGNGNADGTFIYTGFRVGWLMIKNASTGSTYWTICDSKRDGFNDNNHRLFPNENDAESASNPWVMYSNGFKMTTTGSWVNSSGDNYIYMAFAESPFVNSNGVPTNAR